MQRSMLRGPGVSTTIPSCSLGACAASSLGRPLTGYLRTDPGSSSLLRLTSRSAPPGSASSSAHLAGQNTHA